MVCLCCATAVAMVTKWRDPLKAKLLLLLQSRFCCSEDILVFLTGQEEIESVVKSVRDISRDLPSGVHANYSR